MYRQRMTLSLLALATLTLGLGLWINDQAGGSYQARTYQQPHYYMHLRPGGVTADDTQLTPSTSSWYDVNDAVPIPEEWSLGSVSLSVYAYGDGTAEGDPNAGTFDANVYVVTEFGSAARVCALSGTIGELELSHDPTSRPPLAYRPSAIADPNHKWAEGAFTINTGASCWRTDVNATGETNGIGEVRFAPGGATHIVILFDNMASVTKLYALMTGRP